MNNLITQFRIGEKIGASFGLVGLLFLGVIWQYQDTLSSTLSDYQHLHKIQVANKENVLAIEKELLLARMAEKEFRNSNDLHLAVRVEEHMDSAKRKSVLLSKVDIKSGQLAEEITGYLDSYLKHFKALESARVRKGLDENTGLQGSFREAAHDLEDMASTLNMDHIYLNLLQIRRAEKDLGLRRDSQYQQLVHELIGQFEAYVHESKLLQNVKERLLLEIANYRAEFAIYAEKALQGGDLHGGKGLFRDAAHRIEDLINQYYIPNLERDVLQLRRHEKDYLLRADKQYVEMVLKQVEFIKSRVLLAKVSKAESERFLLLLERYRSDFMLLVEQNHEISNVTEQMEQAIDHIVELVTSNVQSANNSMDEMIQTISATTQQRTDWMFWVVVTAIGLGVLFAFKITRHIVGPLHEMTNLLERLTYTDLVDPVRHVQGGRDEVNAMAGYLNTLSDHRNRFVSWWKTAMDEADACEKLQEITEKASTRDSEVYVAIDDIKTDMLEVLSTKKMLVSKEIGELFKETDKILIASALLQHPSIPRGDVDEQSKIIHYAAEMIRKSLNMLSSKTA